MFVCNLKSVFVCLLVHRSPHSELFSIIILYKNLKEWNSIIS